MCDDPKCAAMLADSHASEQELVMQLEALQRKFNQSAKAELALLRKINELQNGEPESAEVRELLEFARATLRKNKNWATTKTGAGQDRYELAAKMLKAHGMDACKTVLIGLAANPYVGPRGRSPMPYPGAKRRIDLQYAFGTSERWENCFEFATGQSWSDADPNAEAKDREWQATSAVPDEDSMEWRRAMKDAKRQGESAVQISLLLEDKPIDKLLKAVESTGRDWRAQPPNKWLIVCPCHDDTNPSCRVLEEGDESLKIRCDVCQANGSAVMLALGLKESDLFAYDPNYRRAA